MATAFPSYPSIRAMLADRLPQEPVYCLKPDSIKAAAQRFLQDFPGETLYAVKCNPHPAVLKILYESGVRHFDTASIGEIRLIRKLFPDAQCYFMHPVKSKAALAEAYHQHGVRHFVLDHENEFAKLQAVLPLEECTLYVRLAPPSTTAVFDFSEKFGARPEQAVDLLQKVAASGARAAVSFHIGSQCVTPHVFSETLAVLKTVLEAAQVPIVALDIGGGFPAAYDGVDTPPLSDFFQEITKGVAALDLPSPVPLLCEPGRGLVAEGMALVLQIQLRKHNALYVNDSIYGSLSEVWTGRLQVPASLVRLDGEPDSLVQNFKIYGCTCDSVDVLPVQFSLPVDAQEGDWVVIRLMGAYSNALRSQFNGFYPDDWVLLAGE